MMIANITSLVAIILCSTLLGFILGAMYVSRQYRLELQQLVDKVEWIQLTDLEKKHIVLHQTRSQSYKRTKSEYSVDVLVGTKEVTLTIDKQLYSTLSGLIGQLETVPIYVKKEKLRDGTEKFVTLSLTRPREQTL